MFKRQHKGRKYEYLVFNLFGGPTLNSILTTDHLTELGKMGWLLISELKHYRQLEVGEYIDRWEGLFVREK